MIFNQATVFGLIEKHGFTSIPDCFPKDKQDMLLRGQEWLKSSLEERICLRAFFHKDSPHFVIIDQKNQLTSMFFPDLYDAFGNDDVTTVGCALMSAGFNLQPATIDKATLSDVVISLMTLGDAKKFDLPICTTELTDIFTKLPDDFNEVEFYETLGFAPDMADDDTLPVIVIIPKILLPTTQFPHALGIELNNEAIQEFCVDGATNTLRIEDFEYAWLKSMLLLSTMNRGNSLHAEGSKLDGLTIDLEAIDGSFLTGVKDAKGTLLESISQGVFMMNILDVMDPLHDTILTTCYGEFGCLLSARCGLLASTASDRRPEPPPIKAKRARSTGTKPARKPLPKPRSKRPTGGLLDNDSSDNEDDNGSVTPTTALNPVTHDADEKKALGYLGKFLQNLPKNEAMAESKDVGYKLRSVFYSHLLASLHSDVDPTTGSTEYLVKLAVFSPHWQAFLKSKDKANCMTLLEGLIRRHSSSYNSRAILPTGHSALPYTEQTLDLLDGPFVNALYHPYFLSNIADIDTHGKHYLMYGSFASPPADQEYLTKQRRAEQLQAQRLRDQEVDASLIAPEPTDLVLHLRVSKPNEIMGNLGNVEHVFGAAVVGTYGDGTPALLESLALVVAHLVHEAGKKWLTKHLAEYPTLGMWITNKLNLIFMRYVAIASSARDTYQVDAEPDPADYLAARAIAESFARVLQDAVAMFTKPEGFDGHPRSSGSSGSQVPPSEHPTSPKKTKRDDSGGAPTDASDPAFEALKLQGMLCLAGRKPANMNCPYPKAIKITKADGTDHHLCLNHMMLGRACRFGDACTRLHLLHFNHLSADNQKAFREWMKANHLIFMQPDRPTGGRGRRTGS